MARLYISAIEGRLRCRKAMGLLALLLPVMLAGLLGTSAPAMAEGYRINAGDVLQITVWKEEGLDREVLVVPDGSITFPLVGEIMAQGKTSEQLRQDLEKAISPMIRDSRITVSVKAALGNTVSVIGQVLKPGDVILGHSATVMQALSMAGGLSPYASEGRILILRQEGDKSISIPFPYADVAKGESLASNIVLRPGDVIVVPTATLF